MALLDIRKFESSFVIHFGGEGKSISAYTLASALVGFADAARIANNDLNPGYDIQIVVDALESGSFKATVRAIFTSARNLFSKELKGIVIGVIASYIYQHTLAPDTEVKVVVNSDEVVIQQGETKIIVPREVHNAVKRLEKNVDFGRAVSEAIGAIERDANIETLSLSPSPGLPEPPVEIPRGRLVALASPPEFIGQDRRYVEDEFDVLIIKALLERTKRKWEFAWHGMRISAPILDEQFYDRFCAHRVTVAPGDILRVKVRILQERSPEINVYLNKSYEIIEVLDHIPGMQQQDLPKTK